MADVKLSDFHAEASVLAAKVVNAVNAGDYIEAARHMAPIFGISLASAMNLEIVLDSDRHSIETRLAEVESAMRSSPEYNHLHFAPDTLHAWAENFLKIEAIYLHRLSTSLIRELDYHEHPPHSTEAVAKLIAQQMMAHQAFEIMLTHPKHQLNLDEMIEALHAQNADDLSMMRTLLSETAPETVATLGIDEKSLVRTPAKLLRMVTSDDVMIWPDVNYRFGINQHSKQKTLYAPYGGTDLEEQRTLTFIEPVGAYEIAGLRGAFTFINLSLFDEQGRNFILERPIIMLDNRLWELPDPIVEKIRRIAVFDCKFPKIHDLLHHTQPVYSDNFTLNPPSAPISFGGRLERYTTYGQSTRTVKEAYESGLAIGYRELYYRRYRDNPQARADDFQLLYDTLELIKETAEDIRDIDPDLANRYAAYATAVYISRALTMFPADAPEFDQVRRFCEELSLPAHHVPVCDLFQIFHAHGAMDVSAKEQARIVLECFRRFGNGPQDTRFSSFLAHTDEHRGLPDNALGDPEFLAVLESHFLMATRLLPEQELLQLMRERLTLSAPERIEGTDALVVAFESIGLLPLPESPDLLTVQGFDRFRWEAINLPLSPAEKGFMEKTVNRHTVSFGLPEHLEQRTFWEIQIAQMESLQADMEIYTRRGLQVDVARSLERTLQACFSPDPLRRPEIESLHRYIQSLLLDEQTAGLAKDAIAVADQCVMQLHKCHISNERDTSRLEQLIGTAEQHAVHTRDDALLMAASSMQKAVKGYHAYAHWQREFLQSATHEIECQRSFPIPSEPAECGVIGPPCDISR